MAESSRIQSVANFFRNGAAVSPESYLNFSRQCLEELRTMTLPRESKSSEIINYEQCEYLVNCLDKAVHKASSFLDLNSHNLKESTLERLKILCMLAKKVKCFVQGSCNGHWLHTVVILTNSSYCTASLVFDLKMLRIHFSASPSTFSLNEVRALQPGGGELVKEMASKGKDRMVTKLIAFICYGQASNDDLELATFLLERLDRLQKRLPSITPGSLPLILQERGLQRILRERDLTNLKHMVQIGRGGCGTVHKASWLGIDVAVKSFHGADNPVFKKEVPILADLSHPNIVSFLGHGQDIGKCCIVMELMDGDLLSLMEERLRSDRTRRSPFSVFEEFDIMLQIAEAMDYLHEMRVLHRDLKSQNILVRCLKSAKAEGYDAVQVKVSDFGLSRTKEFSVTQSQMTPNMGTARWMAPELIKIRNTNGIGDIEAAKNGKLMENYPFKCDVYSFGMLCLEILTGAVPFPNMEQNEVKRAVCAGERPQLPDRCYRRLKALIERCWNPKASSRPCFGDICAELRFLKCLHLMRKAQGTWIRTFTIAELRSVTGNFAESNLLGRGACSVVHKGILADGSEVAVKRVMGAVTELGFELIELQLRGWMSASHPQLVETLGYCIDCNDFLLMTEYMSQGTLAQCLVEYMSQGTLAQCLVEYMSQGTLAQCLVEYRESNRDKALLWKRKLMIAMDVARALVYLHEFDSIFLHFDLKSSNVLLDDDLNAKVSGFGLMNCFEDGSLTQGTDPPGCMSPEYTRTGAPAKAAHVYSFGVVLIELLTGRRAEVRTQDLVTWFRKKHALNFIKLHRQQLFRDLSGESYCGMTELAVDCTADNPDARPDLIHAARVLEQLLRKEGLDSVADLDYY